MDDAPLILLVDDEPSFLEIFSIKLNTAGFRVEVAANGEIGVRKAKEIKPNLILMDMEMPIKTGIEAVHDLKSDASTKDFKIVFLTSHGDSRPDGIDADIQAAKDVGALGYLRKTDDLDNLVKHVEDYLALPSS